MQGIKTDAHGTTVYQFAELPSELGAYVLQIQSLPNQLNAKDIKVEAEGVDVLKIDWVKESGNFHKRSDQELFDRMQSLKERLKELDHKDAESLKFKNQLMKQVVDEKDILSIKELYREKDIEYKKERLRIYDELHQIQNELSSIRSLYSEPNNDTQGTLFLSIIKYHIDAKVLKFKYFLAHPEMNTARTGEAAPRLQKDSQLVKGRVIEASNRLPLMFALVEVYDDKELIQSLYTDEMGVFETKLATNREYSFMIVQEGYKDRKVKKFNARPSFEANYRTYTMKEKDPLSFTEFASYALQVVALISLNW
ncbi:MAG: hypothetical protein CMP59_02510 [Flavobacteriales bacterium]|nr:hypothetical protein [Flavobacteriales bacterium]